eukprot:195193_1
MGETESREENTSGYCTSNIINDDYFCCSVCQHYYNKQNTSNWSVTMSGIWTCGDCERRENERKRQNKRARIKIEWDQQKFEFVKITQKFQTKSQECVNLNSKLGAVSSQIDTEEKKVQNNFKYPEEESNKVVIIIGNTGDGKSTFCNRLSGDQSKYGDQGPFKTSGRSNACTTNISYKKVSIDNNDICFVDTPGFNDGSGNDRYHANNICKYLKGCGGINSFVLIKNSTNCRFDVPFQALLKQYADIFGAECFFSHLIVIATRVDYNNEQFNQYKQAESLQRNIIQLAQQKYNVNNLNLSMIKVIPIGLENYKNSICEFAHNVPTVKFECDAIRSPLTLLRKKQCDLSTRYTTAMSQFNKIRSEKDNIANKVQKCQTRWNNV